ncbi:MAG: sigma-70 family RNA polymerase sigma factor [Planctomycetota bacterium]|jgi:RNA polymerase sigma factor (sigma-70 family)
MTAEIQNEIELLKASAGGDSLAFETIVKKYQAFICAITFSATGNVEKSEELAQEIFVTVWKDLAQLKDLSRFRSWLATVARNIVKNSFRSRQRDPMSKAVPIDKMEDAAAKDCEPAETAITKERQVVVRQALERIPEIYREPLVLFYRQEQSIKQVAEQLELSEEAVRQRLSRGRNLLKEQLAAMLETTISGTGPGKAFTAMVMGSVTALAVKTWGATAASAGATQTATGSLIASTAAKVLTVAAAVAVSTGAVLTYKMMRKTQEDPALPKPAYTISAQERTSNPDKTTALKSEDINHQTPLPQRYTSDQNDPVRVATLLAAPSEIQKTKNKPADYIDWQPNRLDADDGNYSHLVFVKEDTAAGSDIRTLVVAQKQDCGWKIQTVHSEKSYEWSILAVARGKVYCLIGYRGEMFEVDLNSGDRRLVAGNLKHLHLHPSGRLYCFRGDKLVVYDFEHCAFRNIMGRPFDSHLSDYTRIAVSPNERVLAYPELGTFEKWSRAQDLAGAEPIPADNDEVRLVIVDLASGKQTRMPIPFTSPFGKGGGSLHNFPPPIIWMDSNTVLVVRKDRDYCGVAVIEITTGMMWDVAGLPRGHETTPNLGIDKDRQVRLYLTKEKITSTHAIDFDKGLLFETNPLGPFFEFTYIGAERHITFQHKPIEESGRATSVTLTPDERKLAWTRLVPDWRRKGVYVCDSNAPHVQKVSDDYINTGPMWVSDSDVLNQEPPELPAGWQRITTEPWSPEPPDNRPTDVVRERPTLGDVLALTISTDKHEYKQHEPVMLTVRIKNKTDSDLIFETGKGRSTALRVSVLRGRGGGLVGFGRGQERFPPDPLVLGPSESVSYTDIIEPYMLGDHTVGARLRYSSAQWPGRVNAEPIEFMVRESADYNRLLKEKFDRQIECLRSDLPTQGGARGWARKLGPDALQYLIAELEDSNDMKFCKRLSWALKGMVSPQALPFLRKCLTHEMKGDYEAILDTLLILYQNSQAPDEALDLLILGLSHPNPRVRANASERIRVIKDPRVAQAFAECVTDDNEETASNAGRYLAVAEGLDLANWFALAAEHPTYARFVAARSIIDQLEKQWQVTCGDLPALAPEDFSNTSPELDELAGIIRGWETWARKNPNYSSQFFK